MVKLQQNKESDTIQLLSKQVTEAQRAIRILDSIHWTDDVREQFLRGNGKTMPKIDRDWYQTRPLGFDPETTHKTFKQLEKNIKKKLSESHPAGAILLRMCDEYKTTIKMLLNRGKSEFGQYSQELFGSSSEALHTNGPSLADFGRKIEKSLTRIQPSMHNNDPDDVADIKGKEAAVILQNRLNNSMSHHGLHLTVIADDGISADAAAGSDKIKLREDALFSNRELRLLEVHEGWVHVGTTLNGRAQPVCHFLEKGTASSTITQEGLAVLVEILSFASSPLRQRRINNRIIAVEMAESGANFLEVYRFFRDQGIPESDSYQFTMRVFRGSTPEGMPFTKDIVYTKGFISLYNFLSVAVNTGELDLIPLIFCGKTSLKDIGHLRQLYQTGLLKLPVFVPPQFADLHGLAAWVSYDAVLSEFHSEPLQRDYTNMIS